MYRPGSTLAPASLGIVMAWAAQAADREVTTERGEVVILHDDGTWAYKEGAPATAPTTTALTTAPKPVLIRPSDGEITVEWEGRFVRLGAGETLADALAREEAATVAPSSSRAPVAGTYGRWHVTVEKDPMEDKWSVMASNTSTESTFLPLLGSPDATLVARCLAGRMFELYVVTPVVLTADLDDFLTGRVRYDDAPAVGARFGRSSSYIGAFFVNEGGTVAGILSAKTLRVELPPYDASPAVATFELDGATVAMDEVAAACPHALPSYHP